jgi:hypothetical protein
VGAAGLTVRTSVISSSARRRCLAPCLFTARGGRDLGCAALTPRIKMASPTLGWSLRRADGRHIQPDLASPLAGAGRRAESRISLGFCEGCEHHHGGSSFRRSGDLEGGSGRDFRAPRTGPAIHPPSSPLAIGEARRVPFPPRAGLPRALGGRIRNSFRRARPRRSRRRWSALRPRLPP